MKNNFTNLKKNIYYFFNLKFIEFIINVKIAYIIEKYLYLNIY